ncbi:MAG: glutamyl-tRNA reductase, partial [Vicinamibacteria bacterium]|nr:glutamyl-tRNA reductase [Vicinamibacteria bacterium]
MIEIVGLSHRTAPLTLREGMAFARDLIAPMLTRMRAEAGLIECVILSTCNRVELYGCAAEPPAIDRMTEFLARAHGREVREIDAAVYRLSGAAAVRHAFRVAAGLDSMVVGETQILGQVKEAYLRAEEAGTLGAELGTLRNRSLAAAKKARSETGIGRNAVSVSHVAVELARKIFGSLDGKHVLMVGAGKMSELAARHLVEQGARATVLGGRTFERANQLAEALGGRA